MNTKKTFIIALGIFATMFTAAPFLAQGQSADVNRGLEQVGGQIGANTGSGIFRAGSSPVVIIGQVIKILLLISGAVAVLFVVIGGFIYMTSAGNEEQASKGRKTIVNAIIGIVVIILSYVIINVIVNLVNCGGSLFSGC